MIVMVFEFDVKADRMDEYSHASVELRRHLSGIAGFISVERFASSAVSGRFVAIGYFEDEDAVTRWRNLPEHRHAQEAGRTRFFSRYRLVMAKALRDYAHDRGEQRPTDSCTAHGT
jgi:heme-degrading monooxygenase HmoA